MNEKVVDARGLSCPKPLILTKEALQELPIGQSMVIRVDNDTSRQNIERFLKDNRVSAQTTEEEGVFCIHLSKQQPETASFPPETYCSPNRRSGHAIVIRSEQMGAGPKDLGEILMKAFIHTIEAVSPLPAAVIFYNSGVQLVVEGSPLIDPLKVLEAKGVSILVCGTCADYFQVKEKIPVGKISNMYTILETMTTAEHIINP